MLFLDSTWLLSLDFTLSVLAEKTAFGRCPSQMLAQAARQTRFGFRKQPLGWSSPLVARKHQAVWGSKAQRECSHTKKMAAVSMISHTDALAYDVTIVPVTSKESCQ